MPVEPIREVNLEESVLKGVSSLLQMKEGWRKVPIGDGSNGEKDKDEGLGYVLRGIDMNEGTNGDEAENQASNGDLDNGNGNGLIDDDKDEYSIGDFVWGKVNSHPWWPGQIHDPSNASDYALKLKQQGKFLVAYFGDEDSFAWCSSSQLSHFGDQFDEMVKLSKSMNFVRAVESAVEEISRFVRLKMTCSCYKGAILDHPIAINSGLKENVRVPDPKLAKIPFHQPVDWLTILKTKAVAPIKASNLLEISTLKNCVLAFYRSKGVYGFAEYSEPTVIEGLEDPEKAVMGRNRRRGPVEDDEWLKACSSGNGRKAKRKQKSIAEILQIGNTDGQTRKVSVIQDEAEESPMSEDSDLKGFASRERKKSKYLSSPYKNPTKLEGKVSRVLSDGNKAEKKQRRADDDLTDKKKNISAKDVLSEIQTLGIDPDFSKKTESFPIVADFLRDFRISVSSANDPTNSETKLRNKRIKNEDDGLDTDTPVINLIGSSTARKKKKREKHSPNTQVDEPVSEVEFLKKKLDDMSSLLEMSGGNLSEEVRSKLEEELKGVLEKLASPP